MMKITTRLKGIQDMKKLQVEYWHTRADPGFNASTMHQQTLTTDPFGNTCEANEVSPEVVEGGVVGIRCLQPRWDTDYD
jgi:hypothetical protein